MSDAERVVIVGLGPVGATIALLLGRAGIPTLVLERAAEIFPDGRAIALDDEALRVLQAAGLHGTGLPELLTDVPVRLRSRHGRSLLEIAPRDTLTGHPSLVFFNQPDLERRLRSALRRHASVEVLLQHDVERCEQHDDRVEITARDLRSDTTGQFAARWLIACDGASSRIRRDAWPAMRRICRHAWKVAAVMQQQAAPKLLSSYQAERRPHTVRLIALALALGAMIQVRRPAAAALRDVALRTVLVVPRLRHRVAAGT